MSLESEVDLVDRIAQDLPVEVRAAYYRELNHCRSLPESDEMLRILRAMQFLTLLMRQVPEQVAAERARLETLLGDAVQDLRESVERAGEYRSIIENRLTELPAAVAEGLRPELVAREINESLRQQFAASTIPQTAHAMTAASGELKAAVSDFTKVAAAIHDQHRSAAAQARNTIEQLGCAVELAASTARRAAEQMSEAFHRELRWSVYTLVSLSAVLAFGVGIAFDRWISTTSAPASQPEPTHVSAPQNAKPRTPR